MKFNIIIIDFWYQSLLNFDNALLITGFIVSITGLNTPFLYKAYPKPADPITPTPLNTLFWEMFNVLYKVVNSFFLKSLYGGYLAL